MKKIFYLFTIACIVTIAACKEDKCEGVVCQNGGTCQDGACQCNSAFTGPTCETHTNGCDTVQFRCRNSSYCEADTCHCYPHYFGDSCTGQVTPFRVYITGVTIEHFSPAEQNGTTWDDSSNADIYAVIKRDDFVIFNGLAIDTSINSYTFKRDANYFTSYDFVFHEDSIKLEAGEVTNTNYSLQLWDYDDGTNDKLMHEYNFAPYHNRNSFTTSITLHDTTPYFNAFDFRVRLSPNYEW